VSKWRWLASGAAAAVAAVLGIALWPADEPAAAPGPEAVAEAAATPPAASDAAAGLRRVAADGRDAQRELWRQRLQRAKRTLDSYRQATRYPHESRPIAEHPDQVRPTTRSWRNGPCANRVGRSSKG
jgi:hypothetical protein